MLFYGSRNPPRNDASVAAVLDLKTQVWTPTEAVPIDRGVKYRPGQVALGRGGPLLLGGELDRACTDQVFQLDTDSLTWTSVKSLAEPVEGAAVVELPDGRVLLYGGDGPRGEGGPCRNQRSGALIYKPG